MNRVIIGHVLDALKMLDDDSVHLVCTSPPYWGLRDYKAPAVVWPDGWEGQLGLEPRPEMFVEHLVEIFREVKRVLRPDGTVWLNLGDSYAHGGGGDVTKVGGFQGKSLRKNPEQATAYQGCMSSKLAPGLKPKDLCGIPWSVAFALRDDGWYLRGDIIWNKPNPMPESVTDRPTKAHEYLFLLTKSGKYFYDCDAVREPHSRDWTNCGGSLFNAPRYRENPLERGSAGEHRGDGPPEPNPAGRNLRSVWTITTRGYPEAHFAVFPTEIPAKCIKTSPTKICLECGAGWERVVEKGELRDHPQRENRSVEAKQFHGEGYGEGGTLAKVRDVKTLGFRSTCSCEGETGRAVILDPFAGSGTVGEAALKLGRDYILIEISPEYKKLIEKRLAGITAPLLPDAL